jgi:hypothetical protein
MSIEREECMVHTNLHEVNSFLQPRKAYKTYEVALYFPPTVTVFLETSKVNNPINNSLG